MTCTRPIGQITGLSLRQCDGQSQQMKCMPSKKKLIQLKQTKPTEVNSSLTVSASNTHCMSTSHYQTKTEK